MNKNVNELYPHCPILVRTVQLGGFTKTELIQTLKEQNIQMNELAEQLLNDYRFEVLVTPVRMETIELKVRNLGFPNGATLPELFQKAAELDLQLCPLEVAPLLRLLDRNQEEGAHNRPQTKNQAPYGSSTVASPLLSADDDFPKGFYLRKIDGELWLRGYTCDDLHVFRPEDFFVFSLP